jgi:hypothetical protein
MTEFAGVQTNDAPKPNDPPYVDPMQWWYDMSQDEQQAYTEAKVAKVREIGAVVGVHAVTSNGNWVTPTNPDGINPTVWTEYNRIIALKATAPIQPDAPTMRAKLKITEIKKYPDAERLTFCAVYKEDSYPPDGSDEDNTFARWTPSADLGMTINNPALLGKFNIGEKYYVDFTLVQALK